MTIPPARNRKYRRGKEEKDRKVGVPIGEQVGLPADHTSAGCRVDRVPDTCERLASIP